jgi:DNA-binding MarR family transcriptional regulator
VSTPDRGGDPIDDFGQSFKATLAAVRRLRGRDTHRLGELSYAQYLLLFSLADSGAGSSRDIAVAAELAPATVTQMLDSLAAAGLVERVRSEQDRRVVLTSLTERGHALVAERRSHFEPRWRAALAEFSEEELRSAAAVLDRLRGMFDEFAEYPDGEPAAATTTSAHAAAV